VTLTVTDNESLTDTFTADVTVSPALESPVASFTENATTALTDEVIHFNASESNDPDGTIESYFWDFGDGTNASDATVDHSYADDGTYTVTLTVTDDDGLTGSDTATKIIENRPPVALFTQSLTTVETGKTTTFYAGDSYDLDGTIVSYQWNFDDGTVVTETDLSITHVYDDDGSYTVTLTVTDDDGATNSISITKTVLNRPPIALFTQNATTVNVGEAIHFDASDSFDPDGDIVMYFWDFDDLTDETGVSVDHEYTEGGNYTVTLFIMDDYGRTASFDGEITVNAPPEIPWALFAVVGLSVAAAAATLIYLWYRRRKRKKATTKPPTKPAVTLYLPAKILAEPDKSSQSG
jgi:PKD repeat protein